MSKLGKGLLWSCTAVLLLLAVLPFGLMVLTAFQRTSVLRFSAGQFTLDNFINLFTVQEFGVAIRNSLLVVLIACVLNNVVCALAAYGFAKLGFPGHNKLFWFYVATMMVPGQVTMIPLFIIFRQLGILGTPLSLALPVVNAFGVFLIRQFMLSIPDSLLDAARIDGASHWRVFTHIILPLIRPVLVALTVFTFLTTWNDFLWPLIAITSDSSRTVTVAISQLKGSFSTEFGMVMAGTTVAFMVPFIVYVFLQRKFVQGITSSGFGGE
ncbi:carbohydrate ABC transporter permease [Buchananella hordeovulneris]|uniref:Sugar ABC transporter permease n=1 Tax=Buchananella hordeovulneris TaxID=52770 RepID=A0A1Q5PWE2_9ACTO|nr:carbohydrate ABC transporter permease [Buchananella hordeovulneris]MDO5080494.1 carbohydrate ABC transporter permease [Buchananella hordeovulneris]OKL51943.1 sugar ABC transporter permease [Buchananella hordeovulneris]RRD44626.1 carbohydrate ABC transporter permease [Buchananella hordeovulneris]RRD50262.1 carbohydrate ABC transporter permease [Buchananella hordeovulneris]